VRAVAITAVLTIAYGLLLDFVTCLPARLVDTLAAGSRSAGFASGCNFVFLLFYISVLGSVGLGFRIRVSVVV